MKKFHDTCVLTFTSWFGLGYVPIAPGTAGTLGAIPLWWLLRAAPPWVWGVVVVGVSCFAIVLSHRAEKIYQSHDVGHIVIDEVAGMLVTVIGVPFAWPQIIAAFVVFRMLDMFKPGPIRWIDRHVKGGMGVVLDDVAAGVVGCVLLHGAHWLLGGWW